MDWKNNQMVGIGAAVVLILAIVGLFMLNSGKSTGPGGTSKSPNFTFLCKSTGQTFVVNSDDTYSGKGQEYGQGGGIAVTCKICSQKDAYEAYYCPTCKKWYQLKPGDALLQTVFCPEGHDTSLTGDAATAAPAEGAATK